MLMKTRSRAARIIRAFADFLLDAADFLSHPTGSELHPLRRQKKLLELVRNYRYLLTTEEQDFLSALKARLDDDLVLHDKHEKLMDEIYQRVLREVLEGV